MTNDNTDSSPNGNQATVTKESIPSQPQSSTLTNSSPTTTSETPSKQTTTSTAPITTSNNSSSSSSSSSATQPLREDMLRSAVSFLSSPNVRSADNAKKVAFLRQKGLTTDEITEAFKRVGENGPATTATVASTGSVPPRVSFLLCLLLLFIFKEKRSPVCY